VNLLKVADYFCVLSDFVARTPNAPGPSLRFDPTSEVWSLRDDRPSLDPLKKYKPVLEKALTEYEERETSMRQR
jgi:hypothetical protein